ncbi:Serine/threonine-protein kinase ppk5, partial [Fusarium oxysporum f. sp. albedinis]
MRDKQLQCCLQLPIEPYSAVTGTNRNTSPLPSRPLPLPLPLPQ